MYKTIPVRLTFHITGSVRLVTVIVLTKLEARLSGLRVFHLITCMDMK